MEGSNYDRHSYEFLYFYANFILDSTSNSKKSAQAWRQGILDFDVDDLP